MRKNISGTEREFWQEWRGGGGGGNAKWAITVNTIKVNVGHHIRTRDTEKQ